VQSPGRSNFGRVRRSLASRSQTNRPSASFLLPMSEMGSKPEELKVSITSPLSGYSDQSSMAGRVGTGSPRRDSSSQTGASNQRYELTDYEWAAIEPFLPNKPRGVPRVIVPHVLNAILWVP
jgi:hypothetical protein